MDDLFNDPKEIQQHLTTNVPRPTSQSPQISAQQPATATSDLQPVTQLLATSDPRSTTQSRPGWDQYFMDITNVVASRSTCLRRHVGALIVKDRRILASGYNGAPAGLRHCLEIGCLREQKGVPSGERHELCRGLHAEQNAMIQAAVYGTAIRGAIYYVTHQPCVLCAKIIINAGIKKIVFQGEYPDPLSLEMFAEAGVELIQYTEK